MPPKTKFSRKMILNAAFEITKKYGAENANARTVAEKIGCPAQPVMYLFSSIVELK